jgi:hypothetical protein
VALGANHGRSNEPRPAPLRTSDGAVPRALNPRVVSGGDSKQRHRMGLALEDVRYRVLAMP